ncbi:GGDEF domain-containing protein [Gemmatimonas sp.]|uniref:GGDEF domain-containing protein n=1 Tax=Gemmatimonas sp. TaxID=1962908 RepID=UPI0022C82C49|nr:GGDEF domain-containing protein [Gemmatimonas sp.]MCZ8203142.1 GGDEF domain-containing protein [Gemmatimonas sp.]
METERSRTEAATADILIWQTGYRLALAVVTGIVTIALRVSGSLPLSPVADVTLGQEYVNWVLVAITALYAGLVLGIRAFTRRTRSANRTLSTLMVAADLTVVFWLVFLLAQPDNYYFGLFVAFVSLQLTHVYFGRSPALLMLAATAVSYLLLNDIAERHGSPVSWGRVLVTLSIFSTGALLLERVQSNLQERLATLVSIFEKAEEGDFSESYDVAADERPDAITSVGRAYNRMRTQLASIVLTDPLSGCYNRRGFEQQFRRELARAVRANTDVALLAIDLDHFKAVNDTHGHLVGDRVIAEVGELLRANARTEDVVARTGGEEFMILAPSTSIDGAQHLALRIVEAFRRRVFVEPSPRVMLTVSIGVVADAVPNDDMAEDLRARADEALYAAKRSGRNRVVLWSRGLDALKLGQSGSQ